jgi:hypothetical protein
VANNRQNYPPRSGKFGRRLELRIRRSRILRFIAFAAQTGRCVFLGKTPSRRANTAAAEKAAAAELIARLRFLPQRG